MTRAIRPIYVYVDTSVFGGVFDEEFSRASRRFFDLTETGRFRIAISPVVMDEIGNAPSKVRAFYNDIKTRFDVLEISDSVISLSRAYIDARVVTRKWEADARHVALATVARCSMIITWNFKHIVSFRRIPLYNAVNRANGYGDIGIYSPLEVIEDEKD